MDGSRFYLGHLVRVPVYVGFEAIFLLGFAWFAYAGQPAGVLLLGLTALLMAIVLHELGHALVAQAFKMRDVAITIGALGGYCSYIGEPPPAKKVAISLAGPGANFVVVGLILAAWHFRLVSDPTASQFLKMLFTWNLVLGVLNSFPLYPLDGGQVAYAIAKASSRSLATANKVTLGLSVVAGFAMIALDAWLRQGPPSIFNMVLVASLLFVAFAQLRS